VSDNGHIHSIIGWLQERPVGRAYWKVVGGAFALDTVWEICVALIGLRFFELHEPDRTGQAFAEWLGQLAFWQTSPLLIAGSFVEEVFFRFLPLAIAIVIFGRNATMRPYILVVAILFSVLFGFAHGAHPFFLFLQGVGGFVYCIVFLKVSGMSTQYVMRAFLTVWMMHVAWNIGILGLSA